jgi:DNA-binding XRE family transcriptional regulator
VPKIPDMRQIQALREEQNLSRAMLAAKSGVSERVIHLIETETEARTAQARTRNALAKALGVKVSDLFVSGQAMSVRGKARR